MTDWPEHRDELTRKALDHLNDQVLANAAGRLSDVALYLIVDTIITITQGLTIKEDWEVMYAIREDLKARLKAK